ncbi:hypothetical protein [Halobacillus litoralis]|uniref:hypothetical protein n=1 Tax=Halobacillus litoralis TaxID=45668 RepID=UPI00136C52C5|nr:hypothetical protein [Halobacillus litoralis]MYL36474.1 hypothetical protein [Halobacillus litoralis]
MNKTLRRFLIGAGIFAAVGLLAVLVVFIAISGNNEDAVKEDAEAYTENRFQGETDVYGVLYDSMGNQPFKAAAQVRHVDDGIEFLVYRNEDNQLVDTYVSSKWEEEVTETAMAYLDEQLSGVENLDIRFEKSTSSQHRYTPEDVPSVREVEAAPSIYLDLNREPEDGDEEVFEAFATLLKDEFSFTDGRITVQYFDGDTKIKGGWTQEFS